MEVNNYYPYGLLNSSLSYSRSGNRYKYQTKEVDNYFDYNILDFGARHYDAATARWTAYDPASQFATPYIAMGGNPVSGIDPTGTVSHRVSDAQASQSEAQQQLNDLDANTGGGSGVVPWYYYSSRDVAAMQLQYGTAITQFQYYATFNNSALGIFNSCSSAKGAIYSSAVDMAMRSPDTRDFAKAGGGIRDFAYNIKFTDANGISTNITSSFRSYIPDGRDNGSPTNLLAFGGGDGKKKTNKPQWTFTDNIYELRHNVAQFELNSGCVNYSLGNVKAPAFFDAMKDVLLSMDPIYTVPNAVSVFGYSRDLQGRSKGSVGDKIMAGFEAIAPFAAGSLIEEWGYFKGVEWGIKTYEIYHNQYLDGHH